MKFDTILSQTVTNLIKQRFWCIKRNQGTFQAKTYNKDFLFFAEEVSFMLVSWLHDQTLQFSVDQDGKKFWVGSLRL